MDTLTPHEISEKWKQIRSYKVDTNVWYEGESVALMLEFENASEAIEKYVNETDKMWFHEISLLRKEKNENSHPDSIFISYSGVFDMLENSSSPTAQQMKSIFADACTKRIEQILLQRKYERLQKEFEEMKEKAFREGYPDIITRNEMRNLMRMAQTSKKGRKTKKPIKNQNTILKYFNKK